MLTIKFSGEIKVNPETKMYYLGVDNEVYYITAEKYCTLPEEDRWYYFINFSEAIKEGRSNFKQFEYCVEH